MYTQIVTANSTVGTTYIICAYFKKMSDLIAGDLYY